MVRIFEACGLALAGSALDGLWTFHQLLHKRTESHDLTRIHSFEKIVLRHYVDSAQPAFLIEPPSPLLDIGTGAGFPGLIMKIVRPDLKIILAESRGKKLEFLDEAVAALGLEDVEIYPHKVTERFDRPVGGLITRDLESIEKTLARAVGFLPKGGRAVFMKGPAVDAEIEAAVKTFGRDFSVKQDHAYRLGDTPHRRRLVVFERAGPPAQSKGRAPGAPKVREIASTQNRMYKVWSKLLDGRGVRKHGLALMSGLKAVKEVLRDFPEACEAILSPGPDMPDLHIPLSVTPYRLRPELFRSLDVFGAGPPLLVVRVPEFQPYDPDEPGAGCTLFLPFQDPANIGAVIRSAAAFGVGRIVLLQEAAHPFHPRSLRAAGPTVFRVPLSKGPSIRDISAQTLPLVALSAGGMDISTYEFPEAFRLLPGVEGPGLPENLRPDATIAIPMETGVESLNAAASVAVALYAWRQCERAKPQ